MKQRVPPFFRLLWPISVEMLMCVQMASCTQAQPQAVSQPAVQTIPLHVLARTIESHAGQAVRTCGRDLRRATVEESSHWMLSVTDPASPNGFPARVFIQGCDERRPPRLANGCIVGRVLREDGSLDPPTTRMHADHEVTDYEWWLHPQCPAS
jgi:hypothetical protein